MENFDREMVEDFMPAIIHAELGGDEALFAAELADRISEIPDSDTALDDEKELTKYVGFIREAVAMNLMQSGHVQEMQKLLTEYYVDEVNIVDDAEEAIIKWAK